MFRQLGVKNACTPLTNDVFRTHRCGLDNFDIKSFAVYYLNGEEKLFWS